MRLPIQDDIVRAFEARDAARIANLYAQNAVFVTPGRPPVEGRGNIARLMAEDLQDEAFNLQLFQQRTDISASGELAYARGSFRASFTNKQSAQMQKIEGTYIQVFRKQDDGSWNIVEDISSPGPAEAI